MTSKKATIPLTTNYPMEVLVQYPTFSIWKKATEVTYLESTEHRILQKRWGNSSVGFVIETV